MKISIIVPIYNMEKYLKRSLDSLVAQTFSNLEIILVDDGSTDSSYLICSEYEKNDDRIILIHKENGGLSSARNAGLERATGDYIGFMDSDDYILKDMYEYLFQIYEETKADIICCGISRVYTERGKTYNTRSFSGIQIYSKQEALYRFQLNNDIGCAAWNKIFRKDVVKNLVFEPYRRLEDSRYVCKAIMNSENIAYGADIKYIYEIRNGSITRSGFDERSYDILNVTDANYNDFVSCKCKNFNPEIGRILWYIVFVNEMIMRCGNDMKIVYKTQNLLKKNWRAIKQNEDIKLIQKVQLRILSCNYNLYKYAYCWYCFFSGKK
ncbi:MAG: glycosyltransferase [Lachnospiraceae bacterium]|nr:glycosyltransferase [Lachnospiraceae bacterium]